MNIVERELCLPGKGKITWASEFFLCDNITVLNSVRMYTHEGHYMGVVQLQFGRDLM